MLIRGAVARSEVSRRPCPLGPMPTMSTDRWLMLWQASPAKFSEGNFQLEGMVHFWTPPMISEPPSRPSRESSNRSRYTVMSPIYSENEGAAGSQVAQMLPL